MVVRNVREAVSDISRGGQVSASVWGGFLELATDISALRTLVRDQTRIVQNGRDGELLDHAGPAPDTSWRANVAVVLTVRSAQALARYARALSQQYSSPE